LLRSIHYILAHKEGNKKKDMDIFEVIRTRRSIRKFRSEPVPKEKLLRILEAANMAQIASNRQPWNFLWVLPLIGW